MPFNLGTKRLAPESTEHEQVQRDKVYPPKSSGPMSNDECDQVHTMVGQASCHDTLINYDKLRGYAHQEYDISSTHLVLTVFFFFGGGGACVCGSATQNDTAVHAYDNCLWALGGVDFFGTVRNQKGELSGATQELVAVQVWRALGTFGRNLGLPL